MPELLIRLLRLIRWFSLSCWLAALGMSPSWASEAPSAAANPEIESRMMALSAELRCLVCQNQTIADSHAGLAEDLRQQIREMLAKGMNESQILDYMTERYGDFVLYRPPFKASILHANEVCMGVKRNNWFSTTSAVASRFSSITTRTPIRSDSSATLETPSIRLSRTISAMISIMRDLLT
jgi:cytochrome c-type biogenesis protein CcmH